MSTSAFQLRRGVGRTPGAGEAEAADAVAVAEPVVLARRGPAPVTATALTILGTLLLGFVGYVGGLSHVVHARAQSLAYAQLRQELASATAPLGQLSSSGAPLALGSPVALLELPGTREVIREGTTSGVLTGGPGHRRDSVLPGQPGISVVYGRRAAFGGPFAYLASVPAGTRFSVTTGQGRQEFRVLRVRHAGDAQAPLPAGGSRLTLVTATGAPYLPSAVVRVDAELVSPVQPAPQRLPVAMTEAEQPLHGDRGALLTLVLWGQALVLAACLTTFLAARWGRRQTWVVAVPLLAVLGVAVAHSGAQLLPNLL